MNLNKSDLNNQFLKNKGSLFPLDIKQLFELTINKSIPFNKGKQVLFVEYFYPKEKIVYYIEQGSLYKNDGRQKFKYKSLGKFLKEFCRPLKKQFVETYGSQLNKHYMKHQSQFTK